MSEVGAVTHARATLHLRIERANGTVEELDVPVATSLTPEEVRMLIARHQAVTS